MLNLSAKDYIEQGNGVITLCGSTRFRDEAHKAMLLLTLENWGVHLCGLWLNSVHSHLLLTTEEISKVKDLHFQKILDSDAIIIIAPGGYIGESTKEEEQFAKYRGKPVYYFDGYTFGGYNLVRSLPNRFSDYSLISPWRDRYQEIAKS